MKAQFTISATILITLCTCTCETNCKHIYGLTTCFSTSNANQVGVLRAGTAVSCTKFYMVCCRYAAFKKLTLSFGAFSEHRFMGQLQRIGMCLWKMQKASCEKVECLVSPRSTKYNYTFCCIFSYIHL